MRIVTTLVTLGAAGLLLAASTLVQDDAAMGPQATPEHKELMHQVGTWDVTGWANFGVKTDFRGTSTSRALDPFWIVSDLEGAFGSDPFKGHGVDGYDPLAKKYTGFWVDSMGPMMTLAEGTWDEASQTLTSRGSMKDPMTGEMGTMTQKVIVKSPDEHMFQLLMPGMNEPILELNYTRKR